MKVNFFRYCVSLATTLVIASPSAQAQTHAQITGVTLPQIAGLEREKASRPLWQHKVDSRLIRMFRQESQASAPAAKVGVASRLPSGASPMSETVVVDVQVHVTDASVAAVQNSGGTQLAIFPAHDLIRVSIPIRRLVDLASVPNVRAINSKAEGAAHQAFPAIDREGVLAHAVDMLRPLHSAGVTGEGVTVGVLSDSIDDSTGSLQKAFDSGVLDRALITSLPGQTGGARTAEGLAMIEIIHAIAPKAKVIFATADGGNLGGPALMADNIIALKDKGCQIIVDDYTYFNESPFQINAKSVGGMIASAVKQVTDAGVLYFSSARNSGNQNHKTSGTWEGDFTDGGPVKSRLGGAMPNGRINRFEFGVTLNTADDAGSEQPRADLFWADPMGASHNDYDLFVVDRFGNVVDSSTNNHDGALDPYAWVPTLNSGQSIIIVKASDSQNRFLHLDIGQGVLRHSTGGSVRGHNAVDSNNAFTVAAAQAPGNGAFALGPGDSVEAFSSDGPRRMFFDADGRPFTPGVFSSAGGLVIHKPDLTAADGVTTSLPKGGRLNPFFGTSAAAPHAAGIAALLLSCVPTPKSSDIRAALQQTAEPIEGDQRNDTAGYGVIMANAAAAKVCRLG